MIDCPGAVSACSAATAWPHLSPAALNAHCNTTEHPVSQQIVHSLTIANRHTISMGDITEQHELASINNDARSSPHLTERPKPEPDAIPSADAASLVEAAGMSAAEERPSRSASPPGDEDVSEARDHSEASSLLPATVTARPQPEHRSASPSLELDKERTHSPLAPAETFFCPPQISADLPGPSTSTIPSGSCVSQSSSKHTSTLVKGSKQIYGVNEGYDDYPHIHNPRSIARWGRLPCGPNQKLPWPRNMHGHRHVTSYAGAPLFRLCSSVPYVLGPLALITRLQLIVETPILLPDEAKELVAARGIDVAALDSYDLALLNVLCCLWND
ncbi:hypothetical protein OPT61_g10446 [Boeremia exigua]|uniref:Uncharacterized protein n=1 Tax=Boeremia exigua TaxID=749465 RepID=A0ACC2HQF1_9PLEO|nr:hypothetical protein OPT61_g10446 [Boeremia exigua]